MPGNGGGTAYIGNFVDTPTPQELRIREGGIWVNEDGRISGQIFSCDLQEVERTMLKMSAVEEGALKIVRSGENGFFFPGFIGGCYGLLTPCGLVYAILVTSLLESFHSFFSRYLYCLFCPMKGPDHRAVEVFFSCATTGRH